MGAADSLANLPFTELTRRLASRDPVPGGGSAAALAGAIGAGLVSMVGALTTETGAAELGAAARALLTRLETLAQADADAYDAVVQSRRLPRETDAQRLARTAALRAAMAGAARAPLDTADAALEVLRLAERMAPIGNPNAVSDVGVAALLAAAAVRGALLNVRINLPYLAADEPLRTSLPADIRRVETETVAIEDRVAAMVAERMEPA